MRKKLLSVLLSAMVGCGFLFAEEIDRTSYIANPSFEDGFASWTQNGLQTQTNSDFPMKAGNVYVEKWVSQNTNVGNASITQVVTGLPMGTYKLVAGAMNFNQANETQQCEGAVIFAGEASTPIYTPADYEVVFTTVTGNVEIGFRAVGAKGNWLATDNYRLYYTGPVDYAEVEPAIAQLVAEAQKIDGKMTDEAKQALDAAIAACQAVDANTSAEAAQAAINDLNAAMAAARQAIAAFADLDKAIAAAEPYAEAKMNAAIAADFAAALAGAKAVTTASSADEIAVITAKLTEATAAAAVSAEEYNGLAAAIAEIKAQVAGDQGAAAAMADLIAQAEAMYAAGSGNGEEVAAIIAAMAKECLAYNLDHASGPVPVVTTNPYIARGARIAFGRMDVDANGAEILEEGFCWAENPEPTVLDERSSDFYTHAGKIYVMKDINPATKYYVRAYVITTGYQVGYGEAIKVVTLPAANCTWSWNRNDATDEEDARCRKACSEAISNYNYCSGFRGFHLTANYVKGAGAGNGTADCSYGGWMRISQNVPYQRTGTVQHETNHGVGVGTTDRWYNCGDLRAEVSRGWWLGRRANELVNFFENTPGTMVVTGDRTHMWVVNKEGSTSGTLNYGINGAHEDSGSQLLYYANAMLTEYICEDGLNPTINYHNGMPCYTFDFDEDKKYYLISEDAEMGLTNGGFLSAENDKFRWAPTTEVTDYQAWNIEYNYAEGVYRFKNVGTGKYMSHKGKTLAYSADEPTDKEEFQLMPSRIDITLGNYTTYGFWFSWYANNNLYAIRANEFDADMGYGVFTGAKYVFGDKDANQRFVIVSEDELEAFTEGAGVNTVFAPAEKTIVGIYTIDGKLTNEMRRGINIVRYSDGTAEKVMK